MHRHYSVPVIPFIVNLGYIVTPAVLYADDTLLAFSSAANLQQLLEAIVEEGLKYGLELNWEKTLQMQISTASFVLRPDGQPIKSVREAIYLGGVLACDGRTNRELCRPKNWGKN